MGEIPERPSPADSRFQFLRALTGFPSKSRRRGRFQIPESGEGPRGRGVRVERENPVSTFRGGAARKWGEEGKVKQVTRGIFRRSCAGVGYMRRF